MKNLIIKLKKLIFKVFCILWDSMCFIRSVYCCYLMGIKRPRIFSGYLHWRLACIYADKRSKKWKCNWDQSYKRQGVFAWRDYSLIVCSQKELKIWEKKKLLQMKVNYKKIFKNAYYLTPI
jgi:hypothetical protein